MISRKAVEQRVNGQFVLRYKIRYTWNETKNKNEKGEGKGEKARSPVLGRL